MQLSIISTSPRIEGKWTALSSQPIEVKSPRTICQSCRFWNGESPEILACAINPLKGRDWSSCSEWQLLGETYLHTFEVALENELEFVLEWAQDPDTFSINSSNYFINPQGAGVYQIHPIQGGYRLVVWTLERTNCSDGDEFYSRWWIYSTFPTLDEAHHNAMQLFEEFAETARIGDGYLIDNWLSEEDCLYRGWLIGTATDDDWIQLIDPLTNKMYPFELAEEAETTIDVRDAAKDWIDQFEWNRAIPIGQLMIPGLERYMESQEIKEKAIA